MRVVGACKTLVSSKFTPYTRIVTRRGDLKQITPKCMLHVQVQKRCLQLWERSKGICIANSESFLERQTLSVRYLASFNNSPVRTSASVVAGTSLLGGGLGKGRYPQIYSGFRHASHDVRPSSRRKWTRYLSALFLVITGSAGAWAAYRLYEFRKIGFIPSFDPNIPMWSFGKFSMWGFYKGTMINTAALNVLKRHEDFKFRPDDVVVATFPRSGTTWTQEVVYLISNDADVQKATAKNIDARFPYLEDPTDNVELLNVMESQRFIKTHLPYHLMPGDFYKTKPKVIYVMRNPKDVVVSNYHLWLNLKGGYRKSFAQYCELFFEDKLLFGPWFSHVKGYWERRNDANILFVTYEDMNTNLAQVVEKMSKFLNKSLSPEQVATIVKHCSFDSMKKNDMVNYNWWDEAGLTDNMGTAFMRKGKVGDWKNYFTPELDKRLMDKVGRPLEEIGLKVKYEINLENSRKS